MAFVGVSTSANGKTCSRVCDMSFVKSHALALDAPETHSDVNKDVSDMLKMLKVPHSSRGHSINVCFKTHTHTHTHDIFKGMITFPLVYYAVLGRPWETHAIGERSHFSTSVSGVVSIETVRPWDANTSEGRSRFSGSVCCVKRGSSHNSYSERNKKQIPNGSIFPA